MFNQLAPICEPMLPASCLAVGPWIAASLIPTPLGMRLDDNISLLKPSYMYSRIIEGSRTRVA